jgi:cation:H+ antiporter
MMVINIVWILAGIILVLWGADRLTEGAVALAEKMNISQMVIGLTVVAFGTSMPEFCVSLVSALKGTPDLAVGNIVGSNIFNALLIVGVAALVAPMHILKSSVNKDLPFAVLASVALIVLCYFGHDISRIDAAILFILFIVFMVVTLKGAKNSGEEEEGKKKNWPVWKGVLWVVVGLLCLIFGSDIFVDGSTAIARLLGVSDAVIGLTIVAGGTSLPELATSVVAARKGNSDIAIGNVLGSNVFNILFILGVTGLICPMTITGITYLDMSVLVFSVMLLWWFSFTKYTIQRWEGAVLLLSYLGYIGWLVAHAA